MRIPNFAPLEPFLTILLKSFNNIERGREKEINFQTQVYITPTRPSLAIFI